MPQLDELLAKAKLKKETQKTFSRGNRPDRIASGTQVNYPSVPDQEIGNLNLSVETPNLVIPSPNDCHAFKISDLGTNENKTGLGGETQFTSTVISKSTLSGSQNFDNATTESRKFVELPDVFANENTEQSHDSIAQSLSFQKSEQKSEQNQNKPRTNTEQSQNTTQLESRINPEQIQNKPPSQARTNPELSQNKPRTNPEQKILHPYAFQNKPPSQARTPSRTKSEQIQNKPRTEHTFVSLAGLQKNIILFIYDLCRTRGEKISGNVSLEQLADTCKTTPGAAQVTTRRLMKKGLLGRANYKTGRGGYTNYELPENVYSELFQLESQNKVRTNPEQIQNKPPSQARTQARTSVPSSSSKDLNNITTTTEPSTSLPKDWLEIDTSPLSEMRFGNPHLVQLFRAGLSAEDVQDSIYAFAFDLAENGKAKEINGSPLNYFMGILRKGPYVPAKNYESPQDRQQRLYLEFKKREKKVREERESELEQLEFEDWIERTPLEEKTKLIPPTEFCKPGGAGYNSMLREYFRENIWPTKRKSIPGGNRGMSTNE